ncbi:hypothetical protein C8R43DRAFT_4164 [Mycena crocata]|nr:hypothetical protein C8R43DRAFT_4164 [Mycena crocata]
MPLRLHTPGSRTMVWARSLLSGGSTSGWRYPCPTRCTSGASASTPFSTSQTSSKTGTPPATRTSHTRSTMPPGVRARSTKNTLTVKGSLNPKHACTMPLCRRRMSRTGSTTSPPRLAHPRKNPSPRLRGRATSLRIRTPVQARGIRLPPPPRGSPTTRPSSTSPPRTRSPDTLRRWRRCAACAHWRTRSTSSSRSETLLTGAGRSRCHRKRAISCFPARRSLAVTNRPQVLRLCPRPHPASLALRLLRRLRCACDPRRPCATSHPFRTASHSWKPMQTIWGSAPGRC